MDASQNWDLVIIGGGPAGLSAAVNGASEGLKCLVLDGANQFGGQAGTSSLIENLPGFVNGVSGPELTQSITAQARRLGAQFLAPVLADCISRDGNWLNVTSADSDVFRTRAILVSTGVSYRRLLARNVATYLGCGARYGSPQMNVPLKGKKIYLVGGANSAGQAAVWASQCDGCEVHILIRGSSIENKMSSYLIEKVVEASNVHIHTNTEVLEAHGCTKMNGLTLKTPKGNERVDADRLFIMIGAKPRVNWLNGFVETDANNFVLTGRDVPTGKWDRDMHDFEAAPGIFVAGDVRAGSVKRVAAASGEGSAVIHNIHRYFSAVW